MSLQNDIKWSLDSDQILVLTLDAVDQSVNTLNKRFRDSFDAVLNRINAEINSIKGIILTSAKSTFVAGGDLTEMKGLKDTDAPILFETIEGLKKSFRALETAGVPVVAALTGSALGGGFELALACHHRLSLEKRDIKMGLPEVSLGLMPGAGGVVRLVRLLGLEKALPLLIEGKTLAPEKALEAGLIDGICVSVPGLMAQAKQWIFENQGKGQRFDAKGWRIPGGTSRDPALAEKLAVIPAMLIEKTKGCFPAPEAILSTAVKSLSVDLDTALRIESRAFVTLATSQTAQNMIQTFWFQLGSIKQGTFRGDDRDYSPFKKVAVLGAGMMGAGIAYAAAKAGFTVMIKDRSLDAAVRGKETCEKLLNDRIKKSPLTIEEKNAFLARIQPVETYKELESCDLVIEAVFEDRLIKKDVTECTLAVVGPHTIFASNTSTLPITSLAAASPKPEQFIGLHFFSPVDKMQLVEVIKGSKTSVQTVARAFDFVRQLDKIPIVVNDSRGFYTSRVFGTFTQEGMALLGEGQNPASIERAALLSGMPVGPLAVSDEVSLTLFELVQKATKADLKSQGLPFEEPISASIVHKMIHEYSRKGKAHGAGFYEYPKEGKKYLWPELKNIFKGPEIPFQDIKDRLMFVQVLETIRALEEKVLCSVAEANIGSIFGFGFAPASGGTLQFVNAYGLKAFTSRAWELARMYGSRFEPPRLLIEKTEKNDLFL